MNERNSLHWFPFSPAKWKARTSAMSIDAQGAYFALRIAAWEAVDRGHQPCTVPDDDVQLARLSGYGKRWVKLAAEVRPMFEVADDGALLDRDLLATWDDQHRRYTKRADAGSRGGKAKANAEQSSSNATANSKHIDKEIEEKREELPRSPSAPVIVRTSRAGPPRADVEAVVAHYVARFPKRRPGDRERKLIAKHLGTYSAAELCEAIDGNADDEWAKNTGKHELTWTLRDNGQIDTYRAKSERTAVKLDGNGWFADVAS